jgi:hypothetical protein
MALLHQFITANQGQKSRAGAGQWRLTAAKACSRSLGELTESDGSIREVAPRSDRKTGRKSRGAATEPVPTGALEG